MHKSVLGSECWSPPAEGMPLPATCALHTVNQMLFPHFQVAESKWKATGPTFYSYCLHGSQCAGVDGEL